MEKVKKSNQRKMERKRHIKGITLIALIITIIVLLILAGVTIGAITGQNGTINQANAAKEQTEIAQEKETLEIATVKAMGKDKEGNVTKMYLDQELDESVGVSKYSSDDQTTDLGIIVTYLNSGRSYLVDASGNVTDYDKNGDSEEPEEPEVPDITLEIGDYVEYNVTYTDMETDHPFTAQDGWRVLDPGTKNSDGTYSGVKLISTGIPAELEYNYSTIKNIVTDKSNENRGTVGKWAGNTAQRADYVEKFNQGKSNNTNMYAIAGLYYNFELLRLRKYSALNQSNDNEGLYEEINGKKDGELSGEEFIVEEVAEDVHNLTLAELNYARGESDLDSLSSVSINTGSKGLFYLQGLGEYGYDTSAYPYYWLAAPYKGSVSSILAIQTNGSIYTYYSTGQLGLRPVISLKSNILINKITK